MTTSNRFYFAGKWVEPHSTECAKIINPSDQSTVDCVTFGDHVDCNRSVAAAVAASRSKGWRSSTKAERITHIQNFLSVYRRSVVQTAQIVSCEMGAPVSLALQAHTMGALSRMENFLRVFEDLELETELGAGFCEDIVRYEPVGVCGLITPWNWPLSQIAMKVIPAIAAGCTMVLKPSELSPLSALHFAKMIDEAGWPNGVFNLINGRGAEIGRQLTEHPDVDMISFTGSTSVGQEVAKRAAGSIKRVTLELGGKGANIIFADADELAVQRGTIHCFRNSGQSCNAPSRMIVERPVYNTAVAIAAEIANKTSVKPAWEPGNHIGPIVSKSQYARVQSYIESGIQDGATLAAGGLGHPSGLPDGFYVRPTVFTDVTSSMAIAREEIFGPVLAILPFDTEEEAIVLANESQYGLTNYVQTGDYMKARRVANQLHCGVVEINEGSRMVPDQSPSGIAPFGGRKMSGYGREGGLWGLQEFLETKAIHGLKVERADQRANNYKRLHKTI